MAEKTHEEIDGYMEKANVPGSEDGNFYEAHYMDIMGNYVKKEDSKLILLRIFEANSAELLFEDILYNDKPDIVARFFRHNDLPEVFENYAKTLKGGKK